MTTKIVTIIPGNPSRALTPNGRAHWATKAREVKQLKNAAYLAAWEHALYVPTTWHDGAVLTCHLTVAWARGRRIHDGDNLLASLKGAIDGVCSGLGINDKQLTFLPVTQERSGESTGWVVMMVEETT